MKMNFELLFKPITPDELCQDFNLFTLVGKDFFAITAGKEKYYNSMVGSGGGFGLFFKKSTTWCLLRKDRYTLEILRKEQSPIHYLFSQMNIRSKCFFWDKNLVGIQKK